MINGVNKINIDEYILSALKEDITSEDISTNSIIKEKTLGSAELICKEDGIICGLYVFERVFKLLDEDSLFLANYKDGDFVKSGELIGVIKADIRVILSGERTALNYLQRMSGIASFTNKYVNALKGSEIKLLDTRKTTPNNRIFEKYAVKIGGGHNHRYNLSDAIMLKDNHIAAAKGIINAVRMAKEYASFVTKIEVETENLDMVKEAIKAKADIIMLDNMDNQTMKEAVLLIGDKAITECSGNITIERLKEIAKIGVNYVSSGALTHSAPIMDISLKNLKHEGN